jgi:beta-glucosidase-like glycosyl hydrolase
MMGALRTFGDASTLVRMAIQAGCDMVLLCNDDTATDSVLCGNSLPPQSEASSERLEKMRPTSAASLNIEAMNQARKLVREYA